ncbi:MAG: HPF/RaiA family ribosome-associated protein [Candidatus Dormibacteraceae bacterium]
MSVEIRTRNIELSDALRNYVEYRLRLSLSRFETRVSRVTIRLADINGRR